MQNGQGGGSWEGLSSSFPTRQKSTVWAQQHRSDFGGDNYQKQFEKSITQDEKSIQPAANGLSNYFNLLQSSRKNTRHLVFCWPDFLFSFFIPGGVALPVRFSSRPPLFPLTLRDPWNLIRLGAP